MLATIMPLFTPSKNVGGYSLIVEKENKLLNSMGQSSLSFDGNVSVAEFEVVNNLGLDVLAGDALVFLKLSQYSIFSDIENDCKVPPHRVVFIITTKIPPAEDFVARIKDLKSKGFLFAMTKIKPEQFSEYGSVLGLMDFLFLNHQKVNLKKACDLFATAYPKIHLVATGVDTTEDFEALTKIDKLMLFEGNFLRVPVIQANAALAPLKMTYLELLKIVNVDDFDLTMAADIIGRDTALVISLLETANRMSANSQITSIRQATAMIGQKDLKKWINSGITKELCVDKPMEITRLSMVRAKFLENLAPLFNMAALDSELFLLGLFSVLDIILERPMDDALNMVNVSKQIHEALSGNTGPFADIFQFMMSYEDAQWHEVSRLLIIHNLTTKQIYQAYIDALVWFKSLFAQVSQQ